MTISIAFVIMNSSNTNTAENEMIEKFAHIYKARGGKWTLFITTGPAINQGVISEQVCDDKTSAKRLAKEASAKPWNY